MNKNKNGNMKETLEKLRLQDEVTGEEMKWRMNSGDGSWSITV